MIMVMETDQHYYCDSTELCVEQTDDFQKEIGG